MCGKTFSLISLKHKDAKIPECMWVYSPFQSSELSDMGGGGVWHFYSMICTLISGHNRVCDDKVEIMVKANV